MTEKDKSFVILIDTNAMTALSLYVESCNAVGKDLGISKGDLKKEFKEQKDIGNDCLDDYLNFKEIKKGHTLYNHLKTKADNVQIYFSLLSEVELLSVFLDRVFDKYLTRKGVPYRIRKKKPFRTQVDFNYEDEVSKYWDDIKEKLEENNIVLDYPESTEKNKDIVQDVFKVTKLVTKHVSLDPVDLYLYTLGIYLRVDEIYTHDIEFRKIINKIRTDIGWRDVNKKIQQDLRKYLPAFAEEAKTYQDTHNNENKRINPQDLPEAVSG